MNVRWTFILLALSALLSSGCTHSLEREGADSPYRTISLALSLESPGDVPESPATKMTATITQDGEPFRGIEQVYVIPFQTESAAPVEGSSTRLGNRNVVIHNPTIGTNGLVANNNSHLYELAILPRNMNRVLAYGKAPDEGENASKDSKHYTGVLTPDGIDNPSGSDAITFHLEPVLSSGGKDELQEAEEIIDNLLGLLNVAMSLMGNSGYASVVSIFDAVKRENQILSCSYPTFDQLRNEIQSALLRIPFESMALIDEIGRISQAVSTFSHALSEAGSTFPVSYGIPEGTFGFWWNGKEFVRMVNSVNIALVDPASYCYPPGLWYYANSTIMTSNDENVKNEYVATNIGWDSILSHYPDGGTTNSSTQGVAIAEPLQYGVGLMSLVLGSVSTEAMGLIGGCPLTGIIIGDQKDVDFRFQPGTGASRYIYDNVIDGELKIGSTETETQTLVLQTVDGSPVHIALEFRNNTGLIRHCQQGDILPRCKFYIAGVLEAPSTSECVFSKDHKTSVTIHISSLRNAYTTVPDLHDPQLEIGLVAEMKWNQITPQSLVLDY